MTNKPIGPGPGCANCLRNYECGVLASALAVLEKHEALSLDRQCNARYQNLILKVKSLGFGFPELSVHCHLKDDKALVRALTQEAIELYHLFNSKLGTQPPEASELTPTEAH